MKETIKQFRAEIAELEKRQKEVKPQRKTVRFTGERTMDPFSAWMEARLNKDELRAMYAAYGLLRGKKFNEIESAAKPLSGKRFYELYGKTLDEIYEGKHPLCTYAESINNYLKEYGYQIPYEDEEYKTCWGETRHKRVYKPENCETIIRIGEQEA